MKRQWIIFLATVLMILAFAGQSPAEVEWDIQRTLKLDAPPVDVAVSLNGKWIFVLSDQGQIAIYSPDGRVNGRINIGRHIDKISVGPREDLLLLSSRADRTVEVLSIDFVKQINVNDSPFKGPKEAPVVIAVFSEFQCVYCRQVALMLDQVLAKNPDTVKIVFKHFPIQRHTFAAKAAAASMAAGTYGKFWEYHDRLYAKDVFGKLSDQKLLDVAVELGIDAKSFAKKMKDPKITAQVSRDSREGQVAGVRGTPTIFVNGRLLKNRSLEGFQEKIDQELAAARSKK